MVLYIIKSVKVFRSYNGDSFVIEVSNIAEFIRVYKIIEEFVLVIC